QKSSQWVAAVTTALASQGTTATVTTAPTVSIPTSTATTTAGTTAAPLTTTTATTTAATPTAATTGCSESCSRQVIGGGPNFLYGVRATASPCSQSNAARSRPE